MSYHHNTAETGQEAITIPAGDPSWRDQEFPTGDEMLRKVMQESAGLLGWGAALLLQIGHPLIAAAVSEHSRFREEPLARARASLDFVLQLIFGDKPEVKATLREFNAIHVPVQGHLPEAAGRFPAGTPYSGHDPILKLWVHDSFLHVQLMVYDRFVRRLSDAERERFYQESKVIAWRMGIPRSHIPPTLTEFNRYVARVFDDNTLAVPSSTLDLSHAVLRPQVSRVGPAMAVFVRFAAFITAGLLPPTLRTAYGLRWDRKRQVVLDALSAVIRLILPFVPRRLRLLPIARKNLLFRWMLGENQGKISQA